jgi:SAM-dependent methyltransferase
MPLGEEDNGWDASADAWIRFVRGGDHNRTLLLDPVMLDFCGDVAGCSVLDVGCGEGRFCRMLAKRGANVTGVDPTAALLEAARAADPGGNYVEGIAERLPFDDGSFDLVVSYVSLIDFADLDRAIAEVARVARPSGSIVIANLNSFATAANAGWLKDAQGRHLFLPLDRYFEVRADQTGWAGISILNWHRPFEAYLQALLAQGLRLRRFAEPRPTPEAVAACPKLETNLRVPWFHAMEWTKD